jgi:hypothetical protein
MGCPHAALANYKGWEVYHHGAWRGVTRASRPQGVE